MEEDYKEFEDYLKILKEMEPTGLTAPDKEYPDEAVPTDEDMDDIEFVSEEDGESDDDDDEEV